VIDTNKMKELKKFLELSSSLLFDIYEFHTRLEPLVARGLARRLKEWETELDQVNPDLIKQGSPMSEQIHDAEVALDKYRAFWMGLVALGDNGMLHARNLADIRGGKVR
jgi:DNA-binding FadR family transcriptional regulator